MLKVLDRVPHSRLRQLINTYRAQELSMTSVLQELQVEAEHWNREAGRQQSSGGITADKISRRCRELQDECDLLATEIVHVRMAIAGIGEALADFEGRVLHLGSARVGARRPA